ncbi:unnamed protein product [Adineta steineri]|uniref:Fatty acyl-CoA reductase n=2 Tax=Adineta steineri TaxID=433720 RepID=A0A818IMH6_9BILA|nr:unnamed protein product [Adineta steineri]
MPRTTRSESSSSSRRSRSPLSEHESSSERTNEYRVHIAELKPGVQENDIRKMFQRYGTLLDVWVASASCFAFVVFKYKEDAQKAIDQMDGRSYGDNRLKVTWARPRTRHRSNRHDPNMRCYKCGQRGHFSRECDGQMLDGRGPRRREDDFGRYPPSNYDRFPRSRSPQPLPPPTYFRHGMPMYPAFTRRYDPYLDGYFPPPERSGGHEYRFRERGTRLTPPSASARYNRRMSASIESSAIADFFKQKSIFITGATGFIGKQLVEKLVRSCPDIENIYLLVRPKRGHDVTERVKELVSGTLFNHARSVHPNFEQKIIPMQGDILDPNFGLSSADETTLIENCHVIFHSAATVRFHEPLRLAVQMNVASVKKLLVLCHKLKKIQSIVHVSTAYANCNRSDVAEMIYPPPIHPSKLLDASEWMDDQVFDTITKKLINDRPNTYTFTKALAEYVISQESKDLPLAIIRPSIVGSSWREPMPGWIDNYNGPSGMIVATGKGMFRIMFGNSTAVADIVPVDVCVNMMIAIAWHTAMKQPKDIPVYHCCSWHAGALTWGKITEIGLRHLDTICMENAITFPNLTFTSNRFRYFYLRLFQEVFPAFVLDCAMRIAGRKPMFLKLCDRIYKSVRTLDFFTSHSWSFPNDNSLGLQQEMNDTDQKIFNFDLKDMDWDQYWFHYCLGAKQYILREDLAHMPKCQKRNQR